MKKLFLLLSITICAINSFAQHTDGVYFKPEVHNDNVAKNIEDYENWNRKAYNWQLGAIGCAAASVGTFIGYATLDTKFTTTFDNKGNVIDTKMRTPAKNYLIAGSLFAGLAILCELSSMECQLRATKSLKMYITNNGAGVTFNF